MWLRLLIPVAVLVPPVALVGCGGGRARQPRQAGLATATSWHCQVTVPNGGTPPGERPGQGDHGNGRLWTALPLDGSVVGVRRELLSHPAALQRAIGDGVFGIVGTNGTVAAKFPWWGHPGETLTITGRRLDQSGPPLRVERRPGSGSRGFWASRIIFPAEGCWSVTGRTQAASLTFVVRVIKATGP
jgi:hypothetical protein